MSTSGTEAAAAGLAERCTLVRRIADDLAHELRNPLNAMFINLEVLRSRVRAGDSAAALERLTVLEQETRRLAGLLDDVLRLLRPEPPGSAQFPVAEILAEVGTLAALLAKQARRGFELRPGGEDVLVHAGREPLRFALLTLCEAAIAGLPSEGDVVTLEAAADAGGVQLTLSVPAVAAGPLRDALPAAGRLLAEFGAPLGLTLDGGSCRARIALARAFA
ncbi:MAG: HAMP domain-containing histidine kinase [Gemmatimonadetes bacterium]|nr:HAMP domain-containing histidine kinase [Gemmatimonadota bacterium]